MVRLTGDVTGFVMIFAAALIFALTSDPPHLFPRLLTRPSLRWIGGVSYVVYVVHFPIGARLIGAGVPPLVNLAVTCGVSLTIAAASWRWFEQPIMAARSRWPMPARDGAAAPRPQNALRQLAS
jgi:peptidoglycan/LPS O-acetylase OafA/YrhL